MSPISSFSTVEESVDEHEIGDEYLTEKEQQQLLIDEEALRETLEEEAKAEKVTADELEFETDPTRLPLLSSSCSSCAGEIHLDPTFLS
ncbi:hypothetical protein Tco_0716640 [Tanacetum coccineum]